MAGEAIGVEDLKSAESRLSIDSWQNWHLRGKWRKRHS